MFRILTTIQLLTLASVEPDCWTPTLVVVKFTLLVALGCAEAADAKIMSERKRGDGGDRHHGVVVVC
jgi:hypothetical protein